MSLLNIFAVVKIIFLIKNPIPYKLYYLEENIFYI